MEGTAEVHDAEQRCWHTVRITDLSKEQVQIAFDVQGAQGTQKSWVSWASVREPPKKTTVELKEGMQVEVNVPVDGADTWWEAEVKQVKGEFAKVHFLGSGYPDDVVDVAVIRPSTGSGGLSRNTYVKHTMSLADEKMRLWFQNNTRVVEEVRTKSGLLALGIEPTKRAAQLKLIGSEKAVSTAKMLLELHIRHQTEMQRIASERAQLATMLEAEKERLTLGFRTEFPITRDVIGLVVGKGGRNIVDTQKATGVDRIEVDPLGPRVVVIGPTQASVDAAKEMLEFVTERVDVKPEQVGWLIGRGGKHFKELQDKTKVTRLNVDKTLNQVVLVGTRSAVDAAILYMDTHLQYLPEFVSEAQESAKLRNELRNISLSDVDVDPAPTRGRGGGKGKGARSNVEREANGRTGPAPLASSANEPSLTARVNGQGEGGPGRGAGRGRGRGGGVHLSSKGEGNSIPAPPSTIPVPDVFSKPEPVQPEPQAAPLPQRPQKGRALGRAPGGGRGGRSRGGATSSTV